MYQSNRVYHHGAQELLGYLTYDDHINQPRPGVLVVHDWSGRNEFACKKADMLAKLGYVGFALDMYGHAQIGKTNEEKSTLMQPLVNDRRLLRARIQTAFDFVAELPEVDAHRIAVIGFCFGGLCALDLARSGANLAGAISFHGLLNSPAPLSNEPIKAKILALHGYEDPMVKPEQVNAFAKEMTDAGADWQIHMYGHVKHAFTNPLAHDTELGLIYNETAAHRATQSMMNFLKEIF